MVEYPFKTPVVRVKQPIGEFYVASVPVRVLMDTCYSEPLSAVREEKSDGYRVEGAQRPLYEQRLRNIAQFIDTEEAAFPNSIILGANSKFLIDETQEADVESTEVQEGEVAGRWEVIEDPNTPGPYLLIPSDEKISSIIDGQHRLFSFPYAEKKERLDMEVVCSIFFDLPKSYQAYVFATINSTQKPVSKSQTYELFGYNVGDEPQNRWSPDKLAVYLTRRLNTEKDSPLSGRVLLAAENDFMLSRSKAKKQNFWMVSMASVVRGISRLISQSPEKDGYQLLQSSGTTRQELQHDKSPLRLYYQEGNDQLIYTIVYNYLLALDGVIWSRMDSNSTIIKTSGFQAVFDLLRRHVAPVAVENKNSSVEFFSEILSKVSHVNFSDEFFSASSGAGAIRIRRCFELCLGILDLESVDEKTRDDLIRVSTKS